MNKRDLTDRSSTLTMTRTSNNNDTRCFWYMFVVGILVLLVTPICGFVPNHNKFLTTIAASNSNQQRHRHRRRDGKRLIIRHDAATTHRDDADLLKLSKQDIGRFHHMKTRGRVMPIIVLGEPILPGQRLFFRSGDTKFEELIKYIARIERDNLESGNSLVRKSNIVEVGILGFLPGTGQPLQIGVTSTVRTSNFNYGLTAANRDKAITTSFLGNQIFRLVADPWMDPTSSFHMAHVEIFDERYDDELPIQSNTNGKTTKNYDNEKNMLQNDDNNNNNINRRHTAENQIETDILFSQIPTLVDDWMELLFEAELATPANLVPRQREIVPDPNEINEGDPSYNNSNSSNNNHGKRLRRKNNYALYPPFRQVDRAVWVAALLNPVQRYPLPVSPEIRPAFLECKNDRDRLALCVGALQTSTQFLEQYLEVKRRGGLGKGPGDAQGGKVE
jgi:hypothetical protein